MASKRVLLLPAAAAALAAAAVVIPATSAAALQADPTSPLALVGGGCVESFDGLAGGTTAASLPPGATFDEAGTNANGTYTAGNGSGNAGDTYSLGATGAADRAFGQLRSGSLVSTLGVQVRNDTGATITSLGIAVDGERWRVGTANRPDSMNFSYSVGATSLTAGAYTNAAALNLAFPADAGTVGARDGNAAPLVASTTLTGLSIAPGATIMLRWTDVDATSADDALGIDNLVLTPNGAATPTAMCSTPNTPPLTTTPIHDVQGAGAISPKAGQSVTIEGVVVGVDDQVGAGFGSGNTINIYPNDRGFFLEAPEAQWDANAATSEGIFVGLTSAAAALPAIGSTVRVTGTVRDGQFAPSFGQTKLEASSFTVTAAGTPLPPAVTIDIAAANAQSIGTETNPTRSYYESLEGMLVTLPSGVAQSGGTNKFGELFLVPGVTQGVLLRTDPVQPGLIGTAADAGAGNPANPYDPPAPSTTYLQADQGDTVTNLSGPLAYTYGNYKVVNQVGAAPTIADTGVAFPYDRLPAPTADQRRIVSFNLENFFPVGGALDGTIVTAEDFAARRDEAVKAIGDLLHAPDVVAVQEIGDNMHLGQTGTTTSQQTLQQLADALNAAGYGTYTAYVLEGNDNRGIDVGFLVRSTVTVLGTADQRGGLTAAGSCADVAGRLFDRPPLFLQVDLGPTLGTPWLVSNHFASKSAPDSCRIAQATWLRGQVAALEASGQQVIVLGDLNAFEDEAALATLQDGSVTSLYNLRNGVAHDEAYSFQFNGLLQTLDHVLVTAGVQTNVHGFTYAHFDNDYADRFAIDGQDLSDHDPAVLTLGPPPAPVIPEVPMVPLLGASALGILGLFALRNRRAGHAVA